MNRMVLRVAVLLVLVAAVAPASPAEAVVQGAVTWSVDHNAKTITALVKLQIYSGCSENPLGDPGAPSCGVQARSQVTQFLADKIKSRMDRVWNKPYLYRCYRLIVIVDIKLAPDASHIDADRIGVMIDPSAVNIRSWVSPENDPARDRWRSDSPQDAPIPKQLGSTWAEGAQSPRKDVLDDGTVLYTNVETYAHELGHILGLDDAYHDVKGPDGKIRSVPNDGAPHDLMSTGGSTISQETIDRLIKRNLPNMRDTDKKPVTDKDFVCGAEFLATISISQDEYEASHFTFTGCGGVTTISYSRSQSMSVVSESAHVDAVTLPQAKPAGWGTQEAVLVAHGTPPDVAVQMVPDEPLSPLYFHIPVSMVVSRSNARPAAGEMPPVEDRGTVPCAGGGGGSTPRSDCGRKEFKADMDITGTKPLELFAVMLHPPETIETLYMDCSGNDPTPGTFALDWDKSELKRNGGAFPDASRLFDPDVAMIEVSGIATARHLEPGFLITEEYEWTLTLCRVKDGQPMPDC